MKALIIDDDAKNRKLISDLLKLKKLETIEAATGHEGVDKVSPDCIICIIDIRLPDIDGYEVSRRIRKKHPQIPLVAYTASVLKEDRDRLEHSSLFQAVLLKPIDLKNFDEVINRLIK